MTKLFEDLFDRALRRQHPEVMFVNQIMREMDGDLAACARLARGMVPAWQEFDDQLMLAARRSRCRVARYHEQCLFCGRSDCPDSRPVTALQADYFSYLLAGGTPVEYEESGS